MRICVIGTGYVGLVSGTCFAEMGNNVYCVDIDSNKIEGLKKGILPIYEPGLEELVKRNVKEKRLNFTTNLKEAVENSLFCFIAVGTPLDKDGSADLQHVKTVAKDIGESINDYKVIVTKSTVPVGTAKIVQSIIEDELKKKGTPLDFDIVSNPEFLKEGMAIEDFLKPDRIVIGCSTEKAEELMKKLYKPFVKNGHPIYCMDVASSEMTKYAANAMLATRISFMNEMANLCEKVGANVDKIREGIGSDSRIGFPFLYAGIGYGGSCFPKDVQAIIKTGSDYGVNMKILEGVEEVNYEQKQILFKKILTYFDGNLEGKRFALWGLAFKPGTDDIRDAPSLELIRSLLDAGAEITAFDSVATENVRNYFKNEKKITYGEDPYSILENADALCLVTEWKQFREPDFDRMKNLMKSALIFDGRNQYDLEEMKKREITYYSMGR
ncbi:MAG: UDP-glucose/GDP-mannose dehydrogenase family protein [Nitrospinae bacterium]|nr:UDP-glucose/GDP-mannose dehydrogenase family protein [Nitrospinota bacterium]